MLMILVLHTRYDGILAIYDGTIDFSHIMIFLFEALCIVGVNIFVLISGYFGINLKKSGVLKLLFQIYFFGLFALIGWMVLQQTWDIDSRHFVKALLPVSQTVWFIPSYIMLMIMSPMLNAFVDKYSIRYIAIFTLSLYGVTYWFGTILSSIGASSDVSGFGGYSWGWFLILYLTGRIIRKYTDSHSINWKYAFIGYLICTMMIICIAILQNFIPLGQSLLWSYNFPLVYISSICLFLCFVKIDIGCNNVINWLAASSFAVLLLHVAPFFRYSNVCKYIFENYSGIACVMLMGIYILMTYVLATFIDQIRIFIYKETPFLK